MSEKRKLLQKSENKLKSLVQNNTPKRITIYVSDKDGNPISIKKYINQKMLDALKPRVEKYDEYTGSGVYSSTYMGGIFPLLALIPAILAGLASASGVAAGISSAVNSAKQSQAADKDKELKQAMLNKLGTGVHLNPYEGRALYDFLKGKGLEIKQLKGGNGLYLQPYESKSKGTGIYFSNI